MLKNTVQLIVFFITTLYCLGQEPTQVGSIVNNTLDIVDIEINRYALINSNNYISLKIKNQGKNTISSLNITWSDGTTTQEAFVRTNIKPNEIKTVKHPAPIKFSSAIEKTITASVAKVNTSTNFVATTSSAAVKFNTVTRSGTKAVVIEEGTGTWCGWCPRGAVALDYMTKKYPKTFVGIAVHVRDPMLHKPYRESAGFRRYPTINIDRDIKQKAFESVEEVEDFYNERKDLKVPADLDAKITANGKELSVIAKAEFLTNLSSHQLRLGAIVVESGVTGTTKKYNQQNMYSGGDYGPMGGYEDKPNPVPAKDMVYDHVGRALLGTYSGQKGSIPSSVKTGDIAEYTFNYTVPEEYNIKNIHIVIVLIDKENGKIINAKDVPVKSILSTDDITFKTKFKVYPNPTLNDINIAFDALKGNYTLTITDMLGKVISNYKYTSISGTQNINIPIHHLSKGNYLITIATQKSSYSKMIIKE